MPTVDLASVVLSYGRHENALNWQLDWHFATLEDTSAKPVLEVDFTDLGSGHADTVPPHTDGPMLRWELPDRLLLQHESGMRAQATPRRIFLDSSTATRSWRPTRQLLSSALGWALHHHDLVLLHGGLIAREGRALALLGPTGAGKTTAVVAAMGDGWEALADDLFLVRPSDEGPQAFGIPKRMMVAPELADVAPAGGEPSDGDGRGRLLLPQEVLGVGWRTLSGVVLCTHGAGPGATRPLDHSAALRVIIGSRLFTTGGSVLRRQLGVLAAVAGVPRYELAHAASPALRPDRARQMLDDVWLWSVGRQDPQPLRHSDGAPEGHEGHRHE